MPDMGIFDFRFSGQSLIKVDSHNSRTSDDIDMKLRQVIKPDKRNKLTSEKSETLCKEILTPLSFMANLEQSGSHISNEYYLKLTFLLKATFYHTKSENRTKKSLTHLAHYCFE